MASLPSSAVPVPERRFDGIQPRPQRGTSEWGRGGEARAGEGEFASHNVQQKDDLAPASHRSNIRPTVPSSAIPYDYSCASFAKTHDAAVANSFDITVIEVIRQRLTSYGVATAYSLG